MELRHLRCFLAVAQEHSLTSGDERPSLSNTRSETGKREHIRGQSVPFPET